MESDRKELCFGVERQMDSSPYGLNTLIPHRSSGRHFPEPDSLGEDEY
jgi:hypothetical protein